MYSMDKLSTHVNLLELVHENWVSLVWNWVLVLNNVEMRVSEYYCFLDCWLLHE